LGRYRSQPPGSRPGQGRAAYTSADTWPGLRARDADALESARLRERDSARKGYVGLVYADGNAMGRLVQELDSKETCRAFSELVDDSVHAACDEALDEVCVRVIEAVRRYPAGRPVLPPASLQGGVIMPQGESFWNPYRWVPAAQEPVRREKPLYHHRWQGLAGRLHCTRNRSCAGPARISRRSS
jgi:hypothetical protein